MAVRRSDSPTGDTTGEDSSAGRPIHEDTRWLTADLPGDPDLEPLSVKVPHARAAKVSRARGPRKRRD